jgi:hypothetical protein
MAKTAFCLTLCGECDACKATLAELNALDAIYAAMSNDDRESLHRIDPDDPRTFALDHKGRP